MRSDLQASKRLGRMYQVLTAAERAATTLAVALCLAPCATEAGRTAHLFLEESQTVPEGDVELEQWVWANGRVPDQPTRPVVDWLWWAPVIGLSPHWEVRLPIQASATASEVALDWIAADVRYRIFPRERDFGWQPLIRLSYVQTVSEYAGPPRLDLDLVTTYGGPSDVRYTINLGGGLGMPFLRNGPGRGTLVGSGGVGASLPLGSELRVAAELFGLLPVLNAPIPAGQLYAGPSLAWARGPFWLTFGSLFGLTRSSSRILPRVLWAVGF